MLRSDVDADAMLKAAGAQIGALAAQNILLVGQLTAMSQKVQKLEKELAEKDDDTE